VASVAVNLIVPWPEAPASTTALVTNGAPASSLATASRTSRSASGVTAIVSAE
jgi:hypothetical protein